MDKTKYILEYRYDTDESDWIFDSEFESATQAHYALVDHVAEYKDIECRIRKVKKIETEEVVGHFMPISSEDYDDE